MICWTSNTPNIEMIIFLRADFNRTQFRNCWNQLSIKFECKIYKVFFTLISTPLDKTCVLESNKKKQALTSWNQSRLIYWWMRFWVFSSVLFCYVLLVSLLCIEFLRSFWQSLQVSPTHRHKTIKCSKQRTNAIRAGMFFTVRCGSRLVFIYLSRNFFFHVKSIQSKEWN